MSRRISAGMKAFATGAAAVGLGWAGYAALAWSRYGRVVPREGGDMLLDRFMPKYEVGERHQIRVAAPAPLTWQAASNLDLGRSPLVRAIFHGRELLMGARPVARTKRRFLDEVQALGWGVLADEPGHRMIFGAATRPWEAEVRFRALEPETFAAFAEPGYAKIAWTIAVEPRGSALSVFRTETRVATTDPDSRRRFRRYWSVFSPGILLIRYEMLRVVRADAERRARDLPTMLNPQ